MYDHIGLYYFDEDYVLNQIFFALSSLTLRRTILDDFTDICEIIYTELINK